MKSYIIGCKITYISAEMNQNYGFLKRKFIGQSPFLLFIRKILDSRSNKLLLPTLAIKNYSRWFIRQVFSHFEKKEVRFKTHNMFQNTFFHIFIGYDIIYIAQMLFNARQVLKKHRYILTYTGL